MIWTEAMETEAGAEDETAEETAVMKAEERIWPVCLSILEKNQNVKPGDILGAVAGESGIPGKMVGSIDMYDKYTFVEVPRENADAVLRAMKDVKIKGKNIHMEKANSRGR